MTGFTSDGNNTYSWTLSGALGNNKYVFAIATTGSSFGTPGSTQVTDANGAGISGTFTTSSSSFPSGNGLAGSTFDFFFNVLPGDAKQTGTTSSADAALAKSVNNQHETSAKYNPYVDYNGAGIDAAADIAFDASHNNVHNNTLTPPIAPSASQQVETTGLTALALAVQESAQRADERFADEHRGQRRPGQRDTGGHHSGRHNVGQLGQHGIGEHRVIADDDRDDERPRSCPPPFCREPKVRGRRRGGVGFRSGRSLGLIGCPPGFG